MGHNKKAWRRWDSPIARGASVDDDGDELSELAPTKHYHSSRYERPVVKGCIHVKISERAQALQRAGQNELRDATPMLNSVRNRLELLCQGSVDSSPRVTSKKGKGAASNNDPYASPLFENVCLVHQREGK